MVASTNIVQARHAVLFLSEAARVQFKRVMGNKYTNTNTYTNEITKYKTQTQTCVVSQQRRARAVQEGNGEALEVVMKLMTGTEHQV